MNIHYQYDFGDGWQHWIEFETAVPKTASDKYPKIIEGAHHCPPEDVGGTGGYEDFLEAWIDSKNPDHRRFKTWAGKAFSPEAFDLEKTQKARNSALKKCRRDYRFRQEN